MPTSRLTSGERLRRERQAQLPVDGTTFDGDVIVVGASAGGHHALQEIVRDLPIDIPAAIIVLIHGQLGSVYDPKGFLERITRIAIVPVQGSEPLRQQAIFILPPGRSASFRGGRIIVDDGTIPAGPLATINRLFTAAAKAYRERVIGVILSGLLKDGTDGLRAVHEAGGLTVVQNPGRAEFAAMPASAMAGLPVTFCLELSEIGGALELLVRRKTQFETGLAVAVRTLQARAKLLVKLAEQSQRNAGTHEFIMSEIALLNRNLNAIQGLVDESVGSAGER